MAESDGGMYTTRAFKVGTLEFAVTTSTVEDQQLVEALFGDVPAAASNGGDTLLLQMLRNDRKGTWDIGGPHLGHVAAATLEGGLNLLVGEVNQCALDADPEHLHVHAAMATSGGRGVIIAAAADTGKTTTVAHLVARGWGFVTDESVRLSPTTAVVTGFTKPASIKPGGHRLVPHLQDVLIPPLRGGPDDFRYVAMGTSGAEVVQGSVPYLVVLLSRPIESTPSLGPTARALHPADAVVALMQETFDAERFGSAAVQLARLAATSLCYELTIGTPTETADAIEALFQLDPPEPIAVGELPPSDAFSVGVLSVAIGDRVVVHDTVTGQIFALDPGGARVWRKLGGWTVDDEIDVDGPVVGQFVGQLRSLGVLVAAS
jgi:hypothetical protein